MRMLNLRTRMMMVMVLISSAQMMLMMVMYPQGFARKNLLPPMPRRISTRVVRWVAATAFIPTDTSLESAHERLALEPVREIKLRMQRSSWPGIPYAFTTANTGLKRDWKALIGVHSFPPSSLENNAFHLLAKKGLNFSYLLFCTDFILSTSADQLGRALTWHWVVKEKWPDLFRLRLIIHNFTFCSTRLADTSLSMFRCNYYV